MSKRQNVVAEKGEDEMAKYRKQASKKLKRQCWSASSAPDVMKVWRRIGEIVSD
jgi:hypothetical protein